jgi:hypothetical protein
VIVGFVGVVAYWAGRWVVVVVTVCDVAGRCDGVEMFYQSDVLWPELAYNLFVGAPIHRGSSVGRPFKFILEICEIMRECCGFSDASFVVAVHCFSVNDELSVSVREEGGGWSGVVFI